MEEISWILSGVWQFPGSLRYMVITVVGSEQWRIHLQVSTEWLSSARRVYRIGQDSLSCYASRTKTVSLLTRHWTEVAVFVGTTQALAFSLSPLIMYVCMYVWQFMLFCTGHINSAYRRERSMDFWKKIAHHTATGLHLNLHLILGKFFHQYCWQFL